MVKVGDEFLGPISGKRDVGGTINKTPVVINTVYLKGDKGDKGDSAVTGDPVQTSALGKNSGTHTLWSKSISAATNVSVEATLACSADDGISGKELSGVLTCTAKRKGTGALAITSQAAAVPWLLDDLAWNPIFDIGGNDLRLRLTSDSLCIIKPRGSVRIELVDTSADAPKPVVPLATQLLALGFTHVWLSDGISLSGSNVDHWLGSSASLAESTAYSMVNATLGGKGAVVTSGANESSLQATGLGTIKSVWVVATTSTALPYHGYKALATNVSVSDHIMVAAQDTTNWYISTGWTHYKDGVATEALTAGNHIYEANNSLSTVTDLIVGGRRDVANLNWGSPLAAVLLRSDIADGSTRSSALALLAAEYGITL